MAVLRSFVASCELAKVDPFAWFQDVLSRIGECSIISSMSCCLTAGLRPALSCRSLGFPIPSVGHWCSCDGYEHCSHFQLKFKKRHVSSESHWRIASTPQASHSYRARRVLYRPT